MAHREDLKTQVHELRYNFDIETGWLYLPHGCCTDMAGCIALFQAIDPNVKRIGTYAGPDRDTSYVLTKYGWKAELPFMMVPCPTCNGLGYTHIDHNPDWCERCGGEGGIMFNAI